MKKNNKIKISLKISIALLIMFIIIILIIAFIIMPKEKTNNYKPNSNNTTLNKSIDIETFEENSYYIIKNDYSRRI